MILDGALGGAGDEHQALRARGEGFLDRILDQRLVDHRQHLFRARLGRGQKARAAPRHGKDRGADRRLEAGPHLLSRAHKGPPPQVAPAGRSVRSAHLKTEGRMLSQERHFGQRQYQPTLWSPQSSHW